MKWPVVHHAYSKSFFLDTGNDDEKPGKWHNEKANQPKYKWAAPPRHPSAAVMRLNTKEIGE
jgi:hypothetical protein